MVMAKRRLAAGTNSNAKEAVEGADPQLWVAQEGIGKGQLHSASARSSVTEEVGRSENKSSFWEVKVGAGEARSEETLGLLERPWVVGGCCLLSLRTVGYG